MNFLETHDLVGGVQPLTESPQQSFNEEVSQVVGQLSRFWGGFRKQGQSAFEAARRDLGQVASQAQRELGRLSDPQPSNGRPEDTRSQEIPVSGDMRSIPTGVVTTAKQEGDTTRSVELFDDNTPSTSLFGRLQAALPSNIVSAVQSHLPETVRNADLNQISSNVLSELQRVHGVTRSQAEGYAQKSESLLREAMKEAQEVLKDAVKVIPPEEQTSASASSGLIWDGIDIWMLPSESSDSAWDATGDIISSNQGSTADTSKGVTTRAETLMKRLIYDPTITGHDPMADPTSGKLYQNFFLSKIESESGGIMGDTWKTRIAAKLAVPGEGELLRQTRDVLVPSKLSDEEFWTRFFFRVYQIETEEEKRKVLLQGSTENEDDFTWEDDEEPDDIVTCSGTQLEVETVTVVTPSAQGESKNVPPSLSGLAGPANEESYNGLSVDSCQGEEEVSNEEGDSKDEEGEVEGGEEEEDEDEKLNDFAKSPVSRGGAGQPSGAASSGDESDSDWE